MKNQTSAARVAMLHPKFIPQATAFIDDIEQAFGLTFFVVQGLRTFAEQDAIYAQGRTTPGKPVTKAKGGQSYHNYGTAVDICPFKADGRTLDWGFDFKKLIPFASAHGLHSGASFPIPDADHFENTFGMNWRDMLKKYNSRDFIPGTAFINL